jgi:hypothetical protein
MALGLALSAALVGHERPGLNWSTLMALPLSAHRELGLCQP